MGWMGRSAVRVGAVLILLAAWGASPAVANSPSASPAITLHASSATVRSGNSVTLTGHAKNAPKGSVVKVYRRPFPYKTATLMATLTPSSKGAYSLKVSPQRNTRYKAELTNTSATASVKVGVFGGLRIHVKALPLGRAGITIVIEHPANLHWSGTTARWYFKSAGHPTFYQGRSTHTQRLNARATEVHTTVQLPAGHFLWRTCFFVPGEHALLNLRRPPGCHDRGYYGSGSLPQGYPGPAAIGHAISYEVHRAGFTSFAVMDSEGRIHGRNINTTFTSASVVKAMLLVAYLRRLQAIGHHTLSSYDKSILNPMIEVSDNNAATECENIVHVSGLLEVAHAAHMTHFSVPTGFWANSQITASDQVKFFFNQDSLIPHEFVDYARYLLSHIVSYESWGIPAVARPRGYDVFFKGGWVPPVIVNQSARLEGHGKRFAISVLTHNDPSFGYGIDTIQGVASILLGG